jgi:hypothetical protein
MKINFIKTNIVLWHCMSCRNVKKNENDPCGGGILNMTWHEEELRDRMTLALDHPLCPVSITVAVTMVTFM